MQSVATFFPEFTAELFDRSRSLKLESCNDAAEFTAPKSVARTEKVVDLGLGLKVCLV